MSKRRIVVTGLGLVSPLGCGVGPVWSRLIASQSGIRRLPDSMVYDVTAKIGGRVPTTADDPEAGHDPDRVVAPKDQKRMDPFILLALTAAEEAIIQAGWRPASAHERERTATIIASGIGGFTTMSEAMITVQTKGPRRLSPFTVPSFLVNLAAGQVSIRHGFRGPIGAPVTACAASVQAIGDGARLIASGEADIAVCGGAESCIERVSLGSFAAAHALSTHFNDAPERASRPFDVQRDGFVMGEGAGMLVIEALDHALARGAEPLAELCGYGTSSDGFHMAAAPADGEGVQRAMRLAIAAAGIDPSEIGYINAHATSTPMGDAAELTAISRIFGPNADVSISSTKSATGHLLGAAGAVEAIFSILALRNSILPPTLNLEDRDPLAGDLDLIGPQARAKPITHALSNGFGFGGVNASVIFGSI
ncbi:MAG: beta-ketoacyl-ACP synthase II [Chelatococcus sp.]|uniref:beta-ketoacyl-ACP synthase II n=1 Tax=Chelatococcus sp. TaxID=1953771 RepID=UPI0025C02E90|nr:beta-ketoacyl-ACP synthase II [Chelatococcus sp.]MBX3539606.1 beta-ketoacyl-ACP synthase II [Chelatococcus sp.]